MAVARTRSYPNAAADLDEHLSTCPSCSSGRACGDGDDIAEAEFRAFRDLQRQDPDTARATQTRRPR